MSQSVEGQPRRGRTRFARLALVGVLSASALVVAPAAQADHLSSARSHIRSADVSLHKLVAGVSSGSISVPLAALKAQLAAAGADTAVLVKHAHTNVVRLNAAAALTKLAAQEARDASQLTSVIGSLSGGSQIDLASFVASVTQGREQALSLVTPLIAKLPVDVQGQIAGVVAQLSNLGPGQVGSLAGAIAPGSIACPVIDVVSQVVATVLASVPTDLSRVTSILSFLPAGAASDLTAVVNGLPTALNSLLASLKSGFACSSTTSVPGLSGVTGLAGVTGIAGDPTAIIGQVLNAVTSLVQSIIGNLPVVGSGQTPSPVSVLAPVTGLISQVTSLIPGLGGLFGGGSGSGLGGLFGGIL